MRWTSRTRNTSAATSRLCSTCSTTYWSSFFFQAEDGIRDHCVTGVQTCALPICHRRCFDRLTRNRQERHQRRGRSEERRVGKECRSRWSPYHYKQEKRPECD